MNHTNIVNNLAYQIERANNLAHLGHNFTLGETNSMAKQGRPGASNTFGDALWLVDYSLWSAAHVRLTPPTSTASNTTQNIKRLHFHQGLNYRYASWQPIASKGNKPATRPPYYGQIMVASALGYSADNRLVNIPLSEDTESAYAVYEGQRLSKVVVTNLKAFNPTSAGVRPGRGYRFKIPGRFHRAARVDRLMAPGSDATGDVSFAGDSYDYHLRGGCRLLLIRM